MPNKPSAAVYFIVVLLCSLLLLLLPSPLHARRGGGGAAAAKPADPAVTEETEETDPTAEQATDKAPVPPAATASAKPYILAYHPAPPDEVTVSVGDVEGVGTNLTLVLTKRSVRSDHYAVGTWSKDGGFKKLEPFPVRTYRGYVQGMPVFRVNAGIEPGGILWAHIDNGRGGGSVTNLAVKLPPAATCTPVMSSGNKVVPVKATRTSPTPGGYLVPLQPMRRIDAMVVIARAHLDDIGGDVETAVAQNEQRVNQADYIYARDIGAAWELKTIVVKLDDSDVDLNKVRAVNPGRLCNILVNAQGLNGPARSWGGGLFDREAAPTSVRSLMRAAGAFAHEAGHKFRGRHNADEGGDCMGGGGPWVGTVNAQYMLDYCKGASEAIFPGVIYSGVLPPFCGDNVANTYKDKPVSINVLDNDYDGNGDPVLLQAVESKTLKGGKAELSPDRKTVLYTPPKGYVGLDRFTYTAADPSGAANATGRVKVDVREEGLALAYHFPMDRMVDGKLEDLGPSKLQGNAAGLNLSFHKGVVGNALYNDNASGRGMLNFPNSSPPGLGSMSISLWVLYPDSESFTDARTILCDGGVIGSSCEGGCGSGWGIGSRAAGKGFCFAGNISRNLQPEAFSLKTEEPLQTNTWYHLALVIDREAKKLRAWVNNKETTLTYNTADIPAGVIDAPAGLFFFNGYSWKNGQAGRMLVDEVRIYTGVLAPKDVAELYAVGTNAMAPVLPKRVEGKP